MAMMKNMGTVTEKKVASIARTLAHVKRIKAWADKREEDLKAELHAFYNSHNWPESKNSSKYLEFSDDPNQDWDSVVCELITATTAEGKPQAEGRLAVRKDPAPVSIDPEKLRKLINNDEDFLKAVVIKKIDLDEFEIDRLIEDERFTRTELADLIEEGKEKYVVTIYKKKV